MRPPRPRRTSTRSRSRRTPSSRPSSSGGWPVSAEAPSKSRPLLRRLVERRRSGGHPTRSSAMSKPQHVHTPAPPDPRRWYALALLCGAFFMVILDANIVMVALPSIDAELGFSESGLQWVVSAYALTFAGLLLLGGRAADLLGRRRVFM